MGIWDFLQQKIFREKSGGAGGACCRNVTPGKRTLHLRHRIPFLFYSFFLFSSSSGRGFFRLFQLPPKSPESGICAKEVLASMPLRSQNLQNKPAFHLPHRQYEKDIQLDPTSAEADMRP